MRRYTSKACLGLIIAIFTLSAGWCSARAIDVGDSMRELVEADWIEQDSRFDAAKPAERSPSAKLGAKVTAHGVTTAQDAAGACDGIKNGRWGFHTASGELDPWWQVDLQSQYKLDRIVIFNRTDRTANM